MLRRSRHRRDESSTAASTITETDRVEDRLHETDGWLFADRAEAGELLAERLGSVDPNAVVVAIPRGGVPVGAAVARRFGLDLDVAIVRKLGAPGRRELALGAVGEGGITVVSEALTRQFGVGADQMRDIERQARTEVQQREHQIRSVLPPIGLTGRSVVIVDDGVATGSTLLAACRVVRAHGPHRIVVAVPVAPPGWKLGFGDAADAYLACFTPEDFMAVGQWYRDFPPVEDADMLHELTEARAERGQPGDLISSTPAGSDHRQAGRDHSFHDDPDQGSAMTTGSSDPTDAVDAVDATAAPSATMLADAVDEEFSVPGHLANTGGEPLIGYLTVPADAPGVVVFAHGSGSGRMSPRNLAVAEMLNRAGVATLVVDLLSVSEQSDQAKAFDIDLLTDRLLTIVEHLRSHPGMADLPVALFGASTGAAAAMRAAAEAPEAFTTVVTRSGRVDLAGNRLAEVRCPVLLIVGGHDEWVLALNQRAIEALPGGSDLEVVPRASHLFSEPGALERVGATAAAWYRGHWNDSL